MAETLKIWQKNVELNSLHPYSFSKIDDTYIFTTKHGIIYHVYFLDAHVYHPNFKNTFIFNIEQGIPSTQKAPLDKRIGDTIVSILVAFFKTIDNAMVMVCDTLDGRQLKRKMRFDRWFKEYSNGEIERFDACADTDEGQMYASIYINSNNINKSSLVKSFYEIVSNDFYPL